MELDVQDPRLLLSSQDPGASGLCFYLYISFSVFSSLTSFLLWYLYSLKIGAYIWLWFVTDLPYYFMSRAHWHLIGSILVAQFQIP